MMFTTVQAADEYIDVDSDEEDGDLYMAPVPLAETLKKKKKKKKSTKSGKKKSTKSGKKKPAADDEETSFGFGN